MKPIGISAGLMIVAAAVLAWEGQFRYAKAIDLEIDRFAGVSVEELRQELGSPEEIIEPATRHGSEIEPKEAFNKILIYKPFYGKVTIFVHDGVAVSSVYHSQRLRF